MNGGGGGGSPSNTNRNNRNNLRNNQGNGAGYPSKSGRSRHTAAGPNAKSKSIDHARNDAAPNGQPARTTPRASSATNGRLRPPQNLVFEPRESFSDSSSCFTFGSVRKLSKNQMTTKQQILLDQLDDNFETIARTIASSELLEVVRSLFSSALRDSRVSLLHEQYKTMWRRRVCECYETVCQDDLAFIAVLSEKILFHCMLTISRQTTDELMDNHWSRVLLTVTCYYDFEFFYNQVVDQRRMKHVGIDDLRIGDYPMPKYNLDPDGLTPFDADHRIPSPAGVRDLWTDLKNPNHGCEITTVIHEPETSAHIIKIARPDGGVEFRCSGVMNCTANEAYLHFWPAICFASEVQKVEHAHTLGRGGLCMESENSSHDGYNQHCGR